MYTFSHAPLLLCGTALVASAAWAAATHAGSAQYTLSSGDSLVRACRQDAATQAGSGQGLCEGYLLGYIQAHPEVGFAEDLPSAFMTRVVKTRAPSHPETNALKRLQYCLEGADSLGHIHTAIAALDPASVANDTPATVIERVLKQDFRCPP